MKHKHNTAKIILDKRQKIIGLLSILLLVLYFLNLKFFGLIVLNFFIHIFFFSVVVLKAGLILFSLKRPDHQATETDERHLPRYCIMMPCYKEGKVIKQLISNINNIDYPKDKLQVLIVVEDDDYDTLTVLKKITLPSHFQIFLVPTPLLPKGKPNACNHALAAVDAEFLVIYDAEDRPEIDQLKKAVKRFHELPEYVVCLQGKLNFFNANENWLTRLFTIEYTTWFDLFILGLSRLHLPIPLGGTTNHIKVKPLKDIGGWDKYNVTEDCDLGIRFSAMGYKVDYLESTTYEEAVIRPWAWIKQRTRWTKGYMVTWLVHMRNPIKIYKNIGFDGMMALQLFVLGVPLTNLINPIMFSLFFIWFAFDPNWIHQLFPPLIWNMGIVLFVIGNSILIVSSMFAVFRRKWYNLILWCGLIPIYWIMQSIATYRALYQLVTKPHEWEKTEHGISKIIAVN